jgi:hypothetical protein
LKYLKTKLGAKMTDQPKNKKTPDKPAAPQPEAKGKSVPEGAKETLKPPVEAGSPKEPPKAATKPPEGASDKSKSVDSKPISEGEATKSGITSEDKNAVGAKVETKPPADPTEPSKRPITAKTSDMAAPKPVVASTTTEKTAIGGSASAAKPQEATAATDDKSQVAPTKPGSEAAAKTDGAPSATSDNAAKPDDAPPSDAAKPTEPPAATGTSQPGSSMQRCPNCGHRNRPGVLICENCGTNLVTGKTSVAGTRDLLRDQEGSDTTASGTGPLRGTAPLVDTSEMKAVQAAGSHVFEDNMVLRIEIEGGTTPILVYPKQEIIFGRRDPTSGGMPDVDLTPYAGYRMGVSRRHAAIRLQDKRLDVSDLGSSNGTFLNGTRLSAHRPYQLRDGDEVRLGQMVMRVFFQTNTSRK